MSDLFSCFYLGYFFEERFRDYFLFLSVNKLFIMGFLVFLRLKFRGKRIYFISLVCYVGKVDFIFIIDKIN